MVRLHLVAAVCEYEENKRKQLFLDDAEKRKHFQLLLPTLRCLCEMSKTNKYIGASIFLDAVSAIQIHRPYFDWGTKHLSARIIR